MAGSLLGGILLEGALVLGLDGGVDLGNVGAPLLDGSVDCPVVLRELVAGEELTDVAGCNLGLADGEGGLHESEELLHVLLVAHDERVEERRDGLVEGSQLRGRKFLPRLVCLVHGGEDARVAHEVGKEHVTGIRGCQGLLEDSVGGSLRDPLVQQRHPLSSVRGIPCTLLELGEELHVNVLLLKDVREELAVEGARVGSSERVGLEAGRSGVLAGHLHVYGADRPARLELVTARPRLVLVDRRQVPEDGLELAVGLEAIPAAGLLEALELAERVAGLLHLGEVHQRQLGGLRVLAALGGLDDVRPAAALVDLDEVRDPGAREGNAGGRGSGEGLAVLTAVVSDHHRRQLGELLRVALANFLPCVVEARDG
mmetsp:Transcript_7946/g.33429  ORF Transcript_7946/g.33429 Transcript_7946/m.33429 type:complete len:371 (-) Transcript_7946:1703-2815(-)